MAWRNRVILVTTKMLIWHRLTNWSLQVFRKKEKSTINAAVLLLKVAAWSLLAWRENKLETRSKTSWTNTTRNAKSAAANMTIKKKINSKKWSRNTSSKTKTRRRRTQQKMQKKMQKIKRRSKSRQERAVLMPSPLQPRMLRLVLLLKV